MTGRYVHDRGMDRWVCTTTFLGVLMCVAVVALPGTPLWWFLAGAIAGTAGYRQGRDTVLSWRDYIRWRRTQ